MPQHTCPRSSARPPSFGRAESGSRSPRVRGAHARSFRLPGPPVHPRHRARTSQPLRRQPAAKSGRARPARATAAAPPLPPRQWQGAGSRGGARHEGWAAGSWAPDSSRESRTCCSAGRRALAGGGPTEDQIWQVAWGSLKLCLSTCKGGTGADDFWR